MIHLLSLLLVLNIVQGKCSYRAAALQYTAQTEADLTPEEYKQLNLNNIITWINYAAKQMSDIVVLPELIFWGPGLVDIDLTNVTYSEKRAKAISYSEYLPENGTVPCNLKNTSFSLARVLSCVARDIGIFVVANFLTLVDCVNQTDCPSDGWFNFNTDIVLDRSGRLVAVYHKHNVYGTWPLINPAPTSEPAVTFFLNTEREACPSVKVGVFICWDLEYSSPWNASSLRELGVKDLVFSTDWASYPPIGHAGTWQQGFAVANKVNLIAANNGASQFQPGIGPSGNGGGIFISGKVLTQAYDFNEDLDMLLVADVPIKTEVKEYHFTRRMQRIIKEETAHRTKKCELTSGPDLDGETIYGMCDIIASPGSWYLSAEQDHIRCEARVTLHANVSVALMAVHQDIPLVNTPGPYKISSCFLLPCNSSGICPNTWPENSAFSYVVMRAEYSPVWGEYIWSFPMMVSTSSGFVSLLDINTGTGSYFTVSSDGLNSSLVLDDSVASASIMGIRRI